MGVRVWVYWLGAMKMLPLILLFFSSLCVVGDVHERGEFEKFRKAAERGDAWAQYNLGVCYINGDGVEQDGKEAVKWFRKAAEQGDADAQYNLGLTYYEGRGVEKDAKEGVKWFRIAAEQGDAEAQYNLGVCYINGVGVLKDPTVAKKWIKKAFEAGNEKAGEFWKKHELWKY